MPRCTPSLLLVAMALMTDYFALGQATPVLVATGDQVVVSLPDSKGSSEVLSVGELVAARAVGGPAVGDKVAVDRTACAASPLPGSATTGCVVKQAAVFGQVKPLSGLPAVTPVPDTTPSNATVSGRVTDFGSNVMAGATVVITGTANGAPFTLTTQTDHDGYYFATVPKSGRYVSTASQTVDLGKSLGKKKFQPSLQEKSASVFSGSTRGKIQPSDEAKPTTSRQKATAAAQELTLGKGQGKKFRPTKKRESTAVLSGSTAPWYGTASTDDLVSGLVNVAINGLVDDYYDAASAAVTFRKESSFHVPVVAVILSEMTKPVQSSLISAVLVGGVKVETWSSDTNPPTPSGSPADVSYTTGLDLYDEEHCQWFKRATGVLVPPFNGSATLTLTANKFTGGAYTLYLNGQSVLSGTGSGVVELNGVNFVEGTPIPFRLDAYNTVEQAELWLDWEMGTRSGEIDEDLTLPDARISLIAIPKVLPDWSTSLAQAFVRYGPTQRLAIRAPANAPPLPAVDDSSACNKTPLWHIADLDPVDGVVPVNQYIVNSELAQHYLGCQSSPPPPGPIPAPTP